MLNYSDVYENKIGFLEQFFDSIKDNSLLYQSTNNLSLMRDQVRSTLNDLLVWGRPHLVNTRGLQWPYEQCALVAPELERIYHQNPDTSVQKEALLFLSFLPVPNQWRWLALSIDTLADNNEIINFLTTEQQTIQSKLTQKSQSTFKLRHFIQILKSPRLPYEKGVLRIFSLPYLFLNKELLSKIAEHYLLYVEPPMGIVFRHAWWRFFTEQKDPCIFGLGGEEDRRFVTMQANTHVLPLAHGDFLSNEVSPDPKVMKDIDIVFNATFDDMPRKRHAFMLDLLTDQRLSTKKVLFIGRGSDHNVETFKNTVQFKRLEDRVTVLSNLRRQDMPLYLARCKTGVHLSLYENTCRCVFEYFRANIPCVISSATAGMEKAIFNAQTGHVADDDQLPGIIEHVLDNISSYSPRKWYLNHSGSNHNSKKLNSSLIDFFTEHNYHWQNDIVPLDSSGATRYLKDGDYRRFLPEFNQLLEWLKPSISGSIKLVVDDPENA
jgi:hypothetical protein